jgi:beta-lactamase class A
MIRKSESFLFAGLLLFTVFFNPVVAQSEIGDLKNSIETRFSGLEGDFAMAFMNLSDPDQSILINSGEYFHAASTMKTPVMIEIFHQSAQGKFNLTDSILVKNEFISIVDGSTYSMDIGEDSEDALYKMIGKRVSIYNLMYEMITVSSNLATNILIELVDAKKVTKQMRDLGAKDIKVLRGVEDIKAYRKDLNNTTTAKDLMIIMQAIATGKAGKKKDCDQMISILKDQKFNDMIPKYLPEDIQVAHKTGSITGVHHDSGIIFLPDGRKYVLVLLSKNLTNFKSATDEMAKISKEVYNFMIR